MNRTLSILTMLIIVFCILLANSCSKNDKHACSTNCVNGALNSATCNCVCNTGFGGAKCDSAFTSACDSVICANDGIKVASGSACACNCQAGTFGSTCNNTFAKIYLTSAGIYTTWKITGETANGTPVNYMSPLMTIATVAGTFDSLNINNFYGSGGVATYLIVSDSLGTITSGTDTITAQYGKMYNYHGTLNASKTIVNYSYQHIFNTTTETHIGTLVKQ